MEQTKISPPKKSRYRGQHKLWVRWLSGRTITYHSNAAQDNDPLKLKAFFRRILEGKWHKIGVAAYYKDGKLVKIWYSDHGRWFTPEEHEAFIAERRQKREAEKENDSITKN